ncbi:MAG TPA: exodeoxyribonuclease V subunit beta [Balneolaceae bacterium]|nr:exodeoxyribonuclease V subunit beta [Balneolaceae bacterium]
MRSFDPFEVAFNGIHLIEASAGTGKTYNIASLYVRAIIETGMSVDEILVVTYTEAATKELRDRLMKRLRESIRVLDGAKVDEKIGEEDSFLNELPKHVERPQKAIQRLKSAVRSFDEAAVYTIHGFCHHTLQEYAFESGGPFNAELIGDDREIVEELIADYWRQWVQQATEDQLKRPLLQLLLNKGFNPQELADSLADFVGKPYLKVSPQNSTSDQLEKKLAKLTELYAQLKQEWEASRDEIFRLLDAGHLSYYSTNWLNGWMGKMDKWLQAEVAPIRHFDKFERFSQAYIDDNLKKSRIKEGITPPQHPFFQLIDDYEAVARSLQNFDVKFKCDLFNYLLEKTDEKKAELQVYSYDDLLTRLKQALFHPERGQKIREHVRRAYPLALVDEFQDTDPIQYQIFKAIYEEASVAGLFMIGDPKQSIYSFREADVFAYLTARDKAPPQNIYNLGRNYRSVPSLIDGINALFSYQENPFILSDISYQPVQAGRSGQNELEVGGRQAEPLEIRALQFAGDEGPVKKETAKSRSAKDAAVQIKKLLLEAQNGSAKIGDRAVQARDIAVLVRSHRQADVVSAALRECGIKSVKHSRESVFKTGEAEELYRVLKAVAEPGNEQLIIAALSTPIFGYSVNELYTLHENERKWVEKIEQFAEWHDMWQNKDFAYFFRRMMQQEKIAEKVMKGREGERKLTNLIHLSELIQQEQQKAKKTGMRSLLKWLLKKRNEEEKEVEAEQLRLESDENLVSVVTMHHSKGLEYPIVFCPFLWDSPRRSDGGAPLVYHDPADEYQAILDLNNRNDTNREQKRLLKAKEELAESVRLAYVAITRAKYKCVIGWVHAGKIAQSPLGCLLLHNQQVIASLESSIFSDRNFKADVLSMFQDSLAGLAEHPSISVPEINQLDEMPDAPLKSSEKSKLQARSFHRSEPLAKGSGMASFSSLTRGEHQDIEMDYYNYYDEFFSDSQVIESSSGLSVFSFPKGPKPGTAIHHIFEEIDFRDDENWDEVIRNHLRRQDLNEHWLPVVRQMLARTVEKSLSAGEPDLHLSAVEPDRMVAEMEFYFTIGHSELHDLLSIIRPNEPLPDTQHGFADEGFLKGFIDLTFEFNGQFYIIDYKTNHLGNSIADYDTENISHEMTEKLYDLQYHLYLVALHRFLKKRISDYQYRSHMGGVMYLFIRGMNDDGREGIYFDRPEAGLINEMDEYLSRTTA